MNRLKDATSPYLLQHADNPVDWYPWGDEAFQTAQREDKPILLSVGYSACHWCHVMAHESFEDPATAAIMNRDFVCIKVDREERPDVDDIYMQATLLFTRGHGGWPMTVFLTPDGQPFHAGTYFPKLDRQGMPSLSRVMAQVIDAYRNRRAQVEQVAREVTEGLRKAELGIGGAQEILTAGLLDAACEKLGGQFDPDYGGLTRGKPKFPGAMNFEFLLQTYARSGDPRTLEMVTFSLRKMAQGGIYDQVGGGFHRYSVDEFWLVPHFEKMLYDNAQLSRLYLHAWQITGDVFFGQIAVEIYDYVLREMAAPGGGFYSSTDADSEGEEGKFFVWTPAELKAVLDEDEVRAAIAYWGITSEGNFEGKNILYVPLDEAVVAESLEIDIETLSERIASARQKLYAARAERIPPHRDEKILTAWNGMMLASLAEAARVLGREDYLEAATRCAAFLLESMRQDGRLLRSHKDGQSHLDAYLEDHANLIDGLIALYQATFEARYLSEALALAEIVLEHFAAPDGGFFDTGDDHEKLILRPRNQQDSAVPSGSSLMAKVLLLLAAYTGEGRYEAAARGVLLPLTTLIREYPAAFGEAASAATLLVRGIDEIAIVGDPANPATGALLEVVNTGYRPGVIRAFTPQESGADAMPPLLAWRALVEGQPAAYVCRHFACLRPVTTPEALRKALEKTP